MADKRFGVRELIVLGSGTPTITSPSDLNLNANTVGISTNITIGGKIGLGGANYGSPGEVLTSNGGSSAPTWQTSSASASGQTGAIQFKNSSGNFAGDVDKFGVDSGSTPRLGIGTDITDSSNYRSNFPNTLVVKGKTSTALDFTNGIQIIQGDGLELLSGIGFADNNTASVASIRARFAASSLQSATNNQLFFRVEDSSTNNHTTFIAVADSTTNDYSIYPGTSSDIDLGKSTNKWKDLYVDGNVSIGKSIYDANGSVGTDGQVLSNVTGVGVSWTDQTGGSGGSSDPVGTIVAWAGSVSTIPSDYQLCDGGSAQTSALQAITGANVPDLKDRFIIGANNVSGTGTYPGVGVGSTGGSANAVLIAHNHAISPTTVLSTGGLDNTILQGASQGTPLDYGTSTGSSTVGKDNTGANSTSQTGTNANLPPYYALCYIIKHTATSGSAANTVSSDAMVLEAAKSAATGNNNPIEFTDIPADALEISLMFNGVSLSGSNDYLIQLGTSSGYIISGYVATSQSESGNPDADSTEGFIVYNNTNNIHHGKFDINKFSSTTYTLEGQTRRSTVSGSQSYGSLNSVSGTITKLRIKPTGTNTFDAGSFSLSYKTPGSANNEGTDAGQGFFENDTTLNSSKTLPANKNVGIFGPYTIGNNVTLTVPTGTTFTVV